MMKIQFDAQQQYQLDAVAAMLDMFDGQPLQQPEYSVVYQQGDSGLFAGQMQTEVGVGNQLLLSDDLLRKNTRAIQERNEIDVAAVDAALEAWPLDGRLCPHFSVEMETGAAKTYVYLRTIYELATRYQPHEAAVIDVLSSYQMERHIQRERDERRNVLRKEVVASPEFQELWSRIKPRTTYRVEFDTDELVRRAISAVRAMPKIEQVEVHFTTADCW